MRWGDGEGYVWTEVVVAVAVVAVVIVVGKVRPYVCTCLL